jgi:glutamyl-tRNA(Gln) amidotransferase subunit E
MELFEKIVEKTKVNPTFVASVLCSTITNLERSGLNSNLLQNEDIVKSFELLETGKIAKESIEMIFENIMAGKAKTTEEAMKNTAIESVNESALEKIIEEVVEKNQDIIKNQKERAVLLKIKKKELWDHLWELP